MTFGEAIPLEVDQVMIQYGEQVAMNTPSDNSVTTAIIQDSAVTTIKIAPNAVGPGKLATDAVETAKILDANVTIPKLEADAVSSLAKAYGRCTSAGALQGSFNVSSITNNGTGDFTYNFINVFGDANDVTTPASARTTSNHWTNCTTNGVTGMTTVSKTVSGQAAASSGSSVMALGELA